MLHEWRWDEFGGGPEIWGQEGVGLGNSLEGGSSEVLHSSGLTSRASVAILDTSELQKSLGDWSTNDTSSSWGWDESYSDRSALALYLEWDSMDITNLVTPISSSDWNERKLSSDEGTLDGNLNFLGDLDSESDVTVLVSKSNNSLESGSLTGLSLLLDGQDLHDLLGKLLSLDSQESVNNLGFLDWDRVGVDFFEDLDVSVLDQSS